MRPSAQSPAHTAAAHNPGTKQNFGKSLHCSNASGTHPASLDTDFLFHAAKT